MYFLPVFAIALLVAGDVGAVDTVDVTTCGQVVPAGSIGELRNDIVCSTDTPALVVETGTRLHLNGFTITGGSSGVIGPDRGRFIVEGPGTIENADRDGIVVGPRATLKVSGITVRGCFIGIGGAFGGDDRSAVRATDVTVTTSRYAGVQATKLRLRNVNVSGNEGLAGAYCAQVIGQDVTANDNGLALSPSSGSGFGVIALDKLRLRNVVATGNRQAGVASGKALAIVGGTVTGNDGLGAGVDVQSGLPPRLAGVTCGVSDQAYVAGVQGWGVCVND
jgi:hypothetical protein